MAFSCLFVCLGNRLIVPNAFSRFGSFVLCRQLVDYCRACLADDLVLGIGSSRTTDCADNHPLFDQWDAASRGNDSIERVTFPFVMMERKTSMASSESFRPFSGYDAGRVGS
jgi:hypothetical protein